MSAKTTALVIGANGILGECIITELRKKGYVTIGTTRKQQDTIADITLRQPDLSFESCILLQKEMIEILAAKNMEISVVVQVAGFGWPDSAMTEDKIKELWQVNVKCPVFWAKAFPCAKHILFSSCAVYGTKGTANLRYYSQSKRNAEEQMKTLCEKLVIVRPTVMETCFAERASIIVNAKGFPTPQEVAQQAIAGLLEGKSIVLPGIQAKFLHFAHKISPSIAQIFLKF